MLQAMRATSEEEATMTVAVVGLGKIGLPLAAQYASRGFKVIGCDVMRDVVDAINRGISHIHEEQGLREAVAAAVANGNLRATLDTPAAAAESNAVVVIVPLVVGFDGSLDFRNLDAATGAVARGLKPRTLVTYETTLPVGTTRHRLGPMLEQLSGLKAGTDFHLAFSPERVYAGRIFEDLRRYPKIVGGIDATSTKRAVEFYRAALDADIWPVENVETAEFAKLAETTYRDVNIALANQLALYGANRGVNVAEAFKAANSQPYSHLHRPGIGVGGHCIPVYPRFLLSDAADGEVSLIRESRLTNDRMPEVCIAQLDRSLGGLLGRKVLVLGISYREDVKELAFSSAIPIVEQLHRAGAHVLIHDPLFTPQELTGFEAEVIDLSSETIDDVDAVIIQAWHHDFQSLDWRRFKHLSAVLDGRGAIAADRVLETGASYLAVGVAESPERSPK